MERSKKYRSRKESKKAKKVPKVPIKTYRWEDIRRARRRGGYPWTHLYKGPLTEKIGPDQFTMDAFRRAKSSSSLGKSDRVDISDVSSWADYSGKTTPTLLQELISEPQEDDMKKKQKKRPDSVVIQEYFEDNEKDLDDEDDVQITEFQMESGESSDNLSQYLDKEEKLPATSKFDKESKRLFKSSKENIDNKGKRAKSEETGTRKRKLSRESNYSKYSLSKLKILQKFEDAKKKIKVPKISLPTKKMIKKKSKIDRDHDLTEDNKKIAKKDINLTHVKKTGSPVYIHIPLKPPPGETDEFSHLELECKQANKQATELSEKKETSYKNEEIPNNEEARDENKHDKDTEIESDAMNNKNETELEKENNKSPFSSLEKGPKVTKKPPLKINPAFKQFLKDVRQLKEKELQEESDKTDKIKQELKENEEKAKATTKSINSKMDAKEINEETPMDLEEQEQISESESSPKEDIFDKLFETSFSKKIEETKKTDEKSLKDDDDNIRRNVRSKSVEPQNKRRSSMDSSYSRKSLSKLAIIKKLKDASGKIKSALSMDNLRKKFSHNDDQKNVDKEEEKAKTKKPSVVKTSQLDKPKKVEPVYIHIPLKPPEGETDQYSYLATEPLTTTTLETKKEERTDSLDSTSPIVSPKNDDIHFIFLTPPSDDEVLDEKEPDIPETPSSSSDDIVLFSSLKKLAQDVVDQVSPESKRKAMLDTVREESVSDKSSINEVDNIDNKNNAEKSIELNDGHEIDKTSILESKEGNEKMIIDVEDGLNEMAKTEEHLKSALKSTEITSQKKVSFKRKSRQKQDKEKNDDYELVQAPKEEVSKNVFNMDKEVEINNQLQNDDKNTVNKLDLSEEKETKKILLTDPSQSMSIDEEKSYLDQKILKDASLEEDYNKWSNNSGDHEYEPINPPDEITVITSTSLLPNVTVVDSDDDPKVIISATDILEKPVEEKRKPFFQFGKIQKDKFQNDKDKSQTLSGSSDTQSRSSLGKDVPTFNDQIKDTESPNKFQVAFKQGTEQLKTKTNQLRNKLHNIKKPTIHLPKAPEFKRPQFKKSDSKKTDVKRFKLERPKINFHFPKIPDTATIHIPHISLPGARKTTETRTVETRQLSTESNADDSEQSTKRHKFDLTFGGTFPRFKKKKAEAGTTFGTVPRPIKEKENATYTASSEGSIIRIPLRSEDSVDNDEKLDLEEQTEQEQAGFEEPISTSTAQLSGNVTIEDEYERENQAINRADYLNRWQYGNFRDRKDSESNEDERIIGQLVEQRFGKSERGYDRYGKVDERIESLQERLRKDEDRPRYIEDEDEEFDIGLTQNRHLITDLDNLEDEQIKDGYSSEGSVGLQKKGRLGKLDIDSDEFFVVHEIREGFHTPANALAQMNEYDPIGSNRSLPMQIEERQESLPIKGERKSIKKPKRRKTPHVSQEEIPGDEESLEGVAIPSKPKRRSKRIKKKSEKGESVVPYQETIPLEMDILQMERLNFPRESLGILGDDEQDDQEFEFEKQMAKNKESKIAQSETPRIFQEIECKLKEEQEPNIPPRKHRSLKSLTQSENDESLEIDNIEAQIIQSDQIASTTPMRPTRRSRSHTSSLSRISLPPSQRDTDSVFTDEGYLGENQQIPSYLIENQNYRQQFEANEEIPSYLHDDERQPCVEEPCVQDLRDYMGYAIVDKTKQRDPPLPPPRTPSRRKKRAIDSEHKFATVPRNIGLNQTPPVRPLRNYSTLSQVKESKKDMSLYENDNENKENENNIEQYIEMDEEINRDLVSGEVVQKMRQRPLPAPPRPPRKPKTIRRSLQDITSQNNIISVSQGSHEQQFKEEHVSTQTEPLPPDFICEEVRQESTDTIITPRSKESDYLHESRIPESESQGIRRFEMYDPRKQTDEKSDVRVKRELITPTQYTFEETVTHGTLLVQPMDGAKVLPEHQLSRERLIRISRESVDEDETSEVPETFKHLKDPKDDNKVEANETVKPEKLQITDLNIERLTVNQLLASKIVVSEIDTTTLLADEIQGKSGTIKLNDLELPSELLSQLTKQASEQDDEQKKTSIKTHLDSAQKPANFHSINVESKEVASHMNIDNSSLNETLPPNQQQTHFQESIVSHSPIEASNETECTEQFQQHDSSPEPPVPPPRSCTLEESPPDAPPRTVRRKSKQDSPKLVTEEPISAPATCNPPRGDMLEPEVDDQPPPRPPQPAEGLYFPSQPPASFYALRAKQYVDENIPAVPRRKRHQSTRSRPVSRSRSTSDDSSGVPRRPSRISRRLSEPSISELSGRLIQACGSRVNNALKRLIYHLTENLLRNADGKQDLHVFMIILLVLIAGLILLGYGEDRTVVHLHHWEYFNPPKDI